MNTTIKTTYKIRNKIENNAHLYSQQNIYPSTLKVRTFSTAFKIQTLKLFSPGPCVCTQINTHRQLNPHFQDGLMSVVIVSPPKLFLFILTNFICFKVTGIRRFVPLPPL